MASPRDVILKRRARFVAAALAAAGVAAAPPTYADDDAGSDASDAADASDASDGGLVDLQGPQVCLSSCAMEASSTPANEETAALGFALTGAVAAALVARKKKRLAQS